MAYKFYFIFIKVPVPVAVPIGGVGAGAKIRKLVDFSNDLTKKSSLNYFAKDLTLSFGDGLRCGWAECPKKLSEKLSKINCYRI